MWAQREKGACLSHSGLHPLHCTWYVAGIRSASVELVEWMIVYTLKDNVQYHNKVIILSPILYKNTITICYKIDILKGNLSFSHSCLSLTCCTSNPFANSIYCAFKTYPKSDHFLKLYQPGPSPLPLSPRLLQQLPYRSPCLTTALFLPPHMNFDIKARVIV